MIFSHSSGVILGVIFISAKEIIMPTIKSISSLKVKRLSIIYFTFGTSLLLILVPLLLRTNYFILRIMEYFNESNFGITNEDKPLINFLIKAILFAFIELLIYVYRKNNNVNLFRREFNLYLSFIYLTLILPGFINTLIADRLVNSIYWITFLSLINININFLKKNLLPTKIS